MLKEKNEELLMRQKLLQGSSHCLEGKSVSLTRDEGFAEADLPEALP